MNLDNFFFLLIKKEKRKKNAVDGMFGIQQEERRG